MSNGTGALSNTYTYDSFGNLTVSSGTLTNPFRYIRREFDQETGIYYYRMRYYDSNRPGISADVRGRRTSATDQNGKTTTYTYDDADRLVSVTDPANNTTQYTYDTEDSLLAITDANNNKTQFA